MRALQCIVKMNQKGPVSIAAMLNHYFRLLVCLDQSNPTRSGCL